jgi:Fic family protein
VESFKDYRKLILRYDSYKKFIGNANFDVEKLTKKQKQALKDFASKKQVQLPLDMKKKEMVRAYWYNFAYDKKTEPIFSPKSFAKKTGMNENTVRREFQEKLKQGFLEKVGRGRYRLK